MNAAIIVDGYRMIRWPDHPRAHDNGYVAEHILVAEKAFGKPLPPNALVHHVDRNRSNNTPINHQTLHKRHRIVDAGGDPAIDKWCCRCKTPRPIADFPSDSSRGDGLNMKCRPCQSKSGTYVARECAVCSLPFEAKQSEVSQGHGLTCTIKCRNIYNNWRRHGKR